MVRSFISMHSVRYGFLLLFQGDRREVELTGEAYFQVAKDSARPFIVRVGEAYIRVLGTAFNISAYPDDRIIKTTLESGSVKMGVSDLEPVCLQPCQQAVFIPEIDVLMCSR